MIISDLQIIFSWWLMLIVLGASVLPIATSIFSRFPDKGYIFSKIFSIAVLTYIIFVLGILHISPFSRELIFFILIFLFLISYILNKKRLRSLFTIKFLGFVIFEELLFFLVLALWAIIRGYNPEIHGLEKYMDFGFMNSILRTEYFPPKDMWLTPFSVNYYYFGHLYSAVLTKLSGIPSFLTYNLILGTVAGLCFTASFSLGMALLSPLTPSLRKIKIIIGGILAGLLVAFSGNLHTFYTLFKPYENEHPVPFWNLAFSPSTFPNSYWYPNATRFIFNTIHEFPIYSWVVADLHGHVLDIPFVLLTIAILYSFFQRESEAQSPKQNSHTSIFNWFQNSKFEISFLLLISFLLGVMYMTNAWDGLIYLLLTGLVLFYLQWKRIQKNRLENTTSNPILQILPIKSFLLKNWVIDLFIGLFVYLTIVMAGFILFSLPFSIHFKPFVSGIGVLCSPEFLTKIGQIGPFLFETNHCQHSLWWQIIILYGFFFFFATSLIIFLRNKKKTISDVFIFLLTFLSIFLIIIPEFLYAKDIYPAHYRANTMFKLVFQAFMMLSLVSAYSIIRIISNIKYKKSKMFPIYFVFFLFSFFFLTSVFIYPYYSTTSYYNRMQNYQGIDGTKYLKNTYPSDFAAIEWLQENVKGQPVILEAQGDSYTDYGRVSTNTGLPTVLGWTVHEWLWRGQYDYEPDDESKNTDATPYYPAPRINDVQKLYESLDINETMKLIRKYEVEYVFIGDLERQKYPNLDENKWNSFGTIAYQSDQTKIYKLSD